VVRFKHQLTVLDYVRCNVIGMARINGCRVIRNLARDGNLPGVFDDLFTEDHRRGILPGYIHELDMDHGVRGERYPLSVSHRSCDFRLNPPRVSDSRAIIRR